MSLDCVREAADQALNDPCVQEFRTTSVMVRVVQWTGERIGSGSKEFVSELPLGKFEVRDIRSRELASNVGRLKRGDVRVFNVVPSYQKSNGSGLGGFTRDQLHPQAAWTAPDYPQPVRNREVEYVLTGDTEGIYSLIDLETDNVTTWNLLLSLTRRTP